MNGLITAILTSVLAVAMSATIRIAWNIEVIIVLGVGSSYDGNKRNPRNSGGSFGYYSAKCTVFFLSNCIIVRII